MAKKTVTNATNVGSPTRPVFFIDGEPKVCKYVLEKDVPENAELTDTKNTAGTTPLEDEKLFLIGARSQADSIVTYTNNSVYVDEENNLYSGGKRALTNADMPHWEYDPVEKRLSLL